MDRQRKPPPPGWRAGLEHYLIFPTIVGLSSGFGRAGTREFIDPAGHIYYWLLTTIPSWWCYTLASWLLALALRPWRPSLWSVLIGGYLIGYVFFWTPLMPIRNAIMAPLFVTPPANVFIATPEWPFFHVAGQILFGTLPWLLVNLVHHVAMGVPKFGYVPPIVIPADALGERDAHRRDAADAERGLQAWMPDHAPASTAAPHPSDTSAAADTLIDGRDGSRAPSAGTQSPLLARLGAPPGTALLALTAQEHYTRVVTTAGSKLLLLRFSDAVREAAPTPGLQVHRSHWVAVDAIDRFTRTGREGEIALSNGDRLPVSRSYLKALQAMVEEGREAAAD